MFRLANLDESIILSFDIPDYIEKAIVELSELEENNLDGILTNSFFYDPSIKSIYILFQLAVDSYKWG